jgi:hypothetical protein
MKTGQGVQASSFKENHWISLSQISYPQALTGVKTGPRANAFLFKSQNKDTLARYGSQLFL